MQLNWGRICDLYLSAVGESGAAVAEQFLHVNEGRRQVYAKLEVEELEETDIQVIAVVSQDYLETPIELEWILSLVNVNNGQKLTAEPGGMRMREQYCAPGTGKPAEGAPQWWVRSNRRIYLRPTPDQRYVFRIFGKTRGTEITREMLEESPLIPADYHMAIVYAAAVSFLRLHPDSSMALGEGRALADLQSNLDMILNDKRLPKQAENLDRRDRFYMRQRFGGY